MEEKKKIKGRRDAVREIEIPEGVSVQLEGMTIIVKKDSNELKRKLSPLVKYKQEGNKLILEAKKATRREKEIIGTMNAHIKNMIAGVGEKFVYKLQAANVHFPMTVSFDNAKKEIIIKNFLGEKKDRVIKISGDVDIKVDKENITIEAIDREVAGQAASMIEKGSRVSNKDRRIYQDGIFITEKPGRSFLH